VLSLKNRNLPNNALFYHIDFKLTHDNYSNYKLFEIVPINVKDQKGIFSHESKNYNTIILPEDAKYSGQIVPIYALKLKTNVKSLLSELYCRNINLHSYADTDDNKVEIGEEINGITYDFNNE
jgi:hypothetical protein